MLPRVFSDRRIRPLLIIGLVFSLGVAVNAFFFPRYAAPVACIVYAVFLQCMRHLRLAACSGGTVGIFLVRMIPVLCLLTAGLRVAHEPLHIRVDRFPTLWYGPGPIGIPRATIASDFENRPGKQLLIVRYAPGHDSLDDWVYNAADIDGSKVVWAREMNAAHNQRLIEYFHDRHPWLIEPDNDPPSISEYPQQDKSNAKGIE
jgi:hypothetical protein